MPAASVAFGGCDSRGAAGESNTIFTVAGLTISRFSLRSNSLSHRPAKTTRASELLVPTYAWFTEDFDTKDLQDAKALLEELGGARASA